MKTQKLKPIACVLAVSLFLAGCNGGRSTASGSSNSLEAAQAIVNNNDANHAAFIQRVESAVQGPVNYEVINREFYTPKKIRLDFDPNDPNLKSNQLASEKSLNVSDNVSMGITVVSGAVAFVPVVGPVLSIATAAFAGPLIDAFTTPEPAVEYDPNNITAQLSRLQSKVAALDWQMTKTNNIFYQSLKEQSANSTNSAQHKLFSAMSQISYGPNLDSHGMYESESAANCVLSTSDLAYHYFGYSGLGFDEFGTSCNSGTELDFMGVAKDLAAYSGDLSISISDKQSFADALVNISAAKIDAGYNGDFSKVTQVTNANQSALIQVLDSMFANLKTQVPVQGRASTNYADTIAQYNASLVFILQSAYNSLQGAFAIEHTNNYLNFLAAVNALKTNSKGYIPQISGYEGIPAINFEVKKVTTLKDLEADYINKENNLLMLYTARTNIMFNTVYKYTVSDNPLTTKTLPALPTSYTVDGKSYKYEVALRPYSEMYPKHYTTLDISNLPRGGLGESGIFYTFGGYSNYYVCGYGVKPADLNDKNCSLYPVAESGFYDGDSLMFKVKPGQYANLPDNLKNASTISTDWYVGARKMPFKFSDCEHPSAATASFVESNDSFRCDSYKTWEPAITNTDAIRIFHNNSSPNTKEYPMTRNNDRGLSISGDVLKQHLYTGNEVKEWVSNSEGKFDSNKFVIDGNKILSDDTFTLLSTSGASSYDNYVLDSKGGVAYSINVSLNSNIGDGGDFIFNASCPFGVDGKTDLQRYESGNLIQPSYISCKVLNRNDDAAIFNKFVDNDRYNQWTPALIVYNGSKFFALKSIREYYYDYALVEDAGIDQASLITQAIIPCSDYPQYCKAD